MELPHSADCLVCGRTNPKGLRLTLNVDTEGTVRTTLIADKTLCGFADIVHGGLLATVFDEVMVWAASWNGRRFCVCGELNVRFVQPATIGKPYTVTAKVEAARSRLIAAVATMIDESGNLIASASAKYLPMQPDVNRQMIDTMLREPMTAEALNHFTREQHA